jgi:hypothetical protein
MHLRDISSLGKGVLWSHSKRCPKINLDPFYIKQILKFCSNMHYVERKAFATSKYYF